MGENKIDVMVFDTHTSEAFSGNPAGVVLDAAGLSGAQMQKIACEIGHSKTVFVEGRKGKVIEMRFFTPRVEVDFSGHAAVAALTALAAAGDLDAAQEPERIDVSSRSGITRAEIVPHPVCGVEISLLFEEPRFAPFGYSRDLLAGVLGASRYQMPDHWPLSMCQAGNWSLVVPHSTREAVDSARPDYEAMAQLNEKIGTAYVMLYTWQGPVDLYCRCFAPSLGVAEEAVSSSGLAAVAALVVKERALQLNPPKTVMSAEQGAKQGRSTSVKIEVTHDEKSVEQVRIRGTAVKVLAGSLRLPAGQ